MSTARGSRWASSESVTTLAPAAARSRIRLGTRRIHQSTASRLAITNRLAMTTVSAIPGGPNGASAMRAAMPVAMLVAILVAWSMFTGPRRAGREVRIPDRS